VQRANLDEIERYDDSKFSRPEALDGVPATPRAGDVALVDGANDFAPSNDFDGDFAMLVTLVRRRRLERRRAL
jgi:hypothetical protein